MNLDRIVDLFSKLPVKHRDTGRTVKFRPNDCQLIFVDKLKAQYAETHRIRAIVLKSRRVGISAYSDGPLMLGHCLAYSQAHAKIVAHEASTSEALFRIPRDCAQGMPTSVGRIMTKRIFVNHRDGDSILDIATAGNVAGGRGLTLSALHLSEAAHFPGQDSFLSLLPAVSEGEGTVTVVESTANGRTDVGEPFYEFWNSAVAGRNGYIAVFIGFLDDPTCIADPAGATDAPATDLEREIMAPPFNATRAQVAWMRRTMEDKCRGLEQLFMQEYPWTPEVAFISTGDPAFPRDELAYARSTIAKPKARGSLAWDGSRPKFERNMNGATHLWQEPQPRHSYYIGADAAVGMEEGDFAAFYVWDGTTGETCARYSDRITPDFFADRLNLVGRWYNDAMLNVELTGNSGREAIRILRDRFMYPNFYMWRGKDDKLGYHKASPLVGWETTTYSRRKLYDTFRTYIRGALHGEDYKALVRDEQLLHQMDLATLKEGLRWEVEKDHDDILVAAMLGVVAMSQYAPVNIEKRIHSTNEEQDREEGLKSRLPSMMDDVAYSLQKHFRQVMTASERKPGGLKSPLEGV